MTRLVLKSIAFSTWAHKQLSSAATGSFGCFLPAPVSYCG